MDARADERRSAASYAAAVVRSIATLGRVTIEGREPQLEGCAVASDQDLVQVAAEVLSCRQPADVLLDVEDVAEDGDLRITARLSPINGFQGADLFSVKVSPQQAATLASSLSMLAHLRRTSASEQCCRG